MPEPFTIAIPEARLAAIRGKVAAFDWDALPDAGGWRSGVGVGDLRRLTDYWRERYDWREPGTAAEPAPAFHGRGGRASGCTLSTRAATGRGRRCSCSHGWPGSFLEFEHLIAPLVADGHDVVVPSLPGFAFSGRPEAPIGPRRVAAVLQRLMSELFGATPYLVQGGDWGHGIGAWIAHDYPAACLGLHLNIGGVGGRGRGADDGGGTRLGPTTGRITGTGNRLFAPAGHPAANLERWP